MERWEREHRRKLLLQGRCGRCAEQVPASVALRGRPCPHCGDRLVIPGGLDAELTATAGVWRWVVYGLVLVSTLVGGLIPLLPTVLVFGSMMVAQVFIVRRPLKWLSPARRVTARFNLSLVLALLNAFNLFINVLILPFVGLSAVVASAVGTLLTVAYVEAALAFVRGRIEAEGREEPLRAWEWALPASLVTLLVVTTVGSVGSVALMAHLVVNSEVVWAADVARFLVGT